MRRRTFLAASGAAAASGAMVAASRRAKAAEPVDLLLVLAIDVSGSVDMQEAQLQRQGYQQALTDKQVLAAATGGPVGAIAVAYVEWAGVDWQRLLIPWTRIAGAADAGAWARVLEDSPHSSIRWTSLSGALLFSEQVLAQAPFEGTRKVIDVSGDGANNSGPEPEPIRDRLVAAGVTINGLPIINTRGWGGKEVVPYYQNSVIGGPQSFLVVANSFEDFGQAIRRKLVQEIA